MICTACRRARPADELLAFWPVGDPDRRRHVCRPSLGLPGPDRGRGSCFATAVGPARLFAIALEVPGPRFVAAAAPDAPIRPGTAAWAELLAFVRGGPRAEVAAA